VMAQNHDVVVGIEFLMSAGGMSAIGMCFAPSMREASYSQGSRTSRRVRIPAFLQGFELPERFQSPWVQVSGVGGSGVRKNLRS